MDEALNLLDATSLLETFGSIGIAAVLVAETGLLLGVFLPGDSLLFTAGILSATSAQSRLHLHLASVVVAAVLGAVLGAQAGFSLGRLAAARLENHPRPRIATGLQRTRRVLDTYGAPRAIVLARFVPVIRTLINPLAGAAGVSLRTFTVWQTVGGVLWGVSLPVLGWQLGAHISNIDHYLLPVIAVIVTASATPLLIEAHRTRVAARHRPSPIAVHTADDGVSGPRGAAAGGPLAAAPVLGAEEANTAPPAAGRPVVRLPASGWPGAELARALAHEFHLTSSNEPQPDVVVLDAPTAEVVRELRRGNPRLGILVHCPPGQTVAILNAGADMAVSTSDTVELAARVRATARFAGGAHRR